MTVLQQVNAAKYLKSNISRVRAVGEVHRVTGFIRFVELTNSLTGIVAVFNVMVVTEASGVKVALYGACCLVFNSRNRFNSVIYQSLAFDGGLVDDMTARSLCRKKHHI
jgi:hypothetical protein